MAVAANDMGEGASGAIARSGIAAGPPDAGRRILQVGAGARIVGGRPGPSDVERASAQAATGGFDLFVALSGPLLVERDGRRLVLARGAGLLVDHGLPVRTRFADGRFVTLQLSRAALPGETARALPLHADASRMILLRCYLLAVLRHGRYAPVPEIAARHLRDLVAATFLDRSVAAGTGGPDGRAAARVAAMRAFVARHHADPDLSMARVAAAVGLSERSGYLAFRAAGRSFSDDLFAVRLDAAAAALRAGAGRVLDVAMEAGFGDLSNFHKRFRSRFGCSPSRLRRDAARFATPDSGW